MSDFTIGIHGIGVYLPETVRRNDWWPERIVAGWRADRQQRAALRGPGQQSGPGGRPLAIADAMTEGQCAVVRGLEAHDHDPFHGVIERHVIADGMQPSEMEARAARSALARAGIDPQTRGQAIDFVLCASLVPDVLTVPNACTVHHQLGLARDSLCLTVDATCNAFAVQLEIARGLLASGRHRRGLLIQSSAMSRLIPPDAPYAPVFGDGATAVVVGQAPPDHGLLASVHQTDGSLAGAFFASVAGKRWHDDGPTTWHIHDHDAARDVVLNVADRGRDSVSSALARAGQAHRDVDFYASHQAMAWFRRITQEHIGLADARSADTFPWAGNLSGANIPLVLASAERDGLLRPGDLVATFSGGSGITWSAMILRWCEQAVF